MPRDNISKCTLIAYRLLRHGYRVPARPPAHTWRYEFERYDETRWEILIVSTEDAWAAFKS